jgi:hypothetical protein
MLKAAQNWLSAHIPEALIAATIGLLGLLGKAVLPALWPALVASVTTQTLLPILGLSLLVNLTCVLALVHMSKERQLTGHIGILWDKDKNPYCPACETLLGGYAFYEEKPALRCVKCEKAVFLFDDGSEIKTLTLDEARAGLAKKLKKK